MTTNVGCSNISPSANGQLVIANKQPRTNGRVREPKILSHIAIDKIVPQLSTISIHALARPKVIKANGAKRGIKVPG
jgi:hypothetical protein